MFLQIFIPYSQSINVFLQMYIGSFYILLLQKTKKNTHPVIKSFLEVTTNNIKLLILYVICNMGRYI